MFGLLKNFRKLMLPLDIQIELFDRLVVPILLYGCDDKPCIKTTATLL